MIYTTEKPIYDKFREVFPLSEDLAEHISNF